MKIAVSSDLHLDLNHADVAEIINADAYDQYLNGGCIRDNTTGKPVKYVPPEPTAEEKKASAASKIAAEYTPQLDELKGNLLTAVMTGDAELESEIKAEYQDLIAETISDNYTTMRQIHTRSRLYGNSYLFYYENPEAKTMNELLGI